MKVLRGYFAVLRAIARFFLPKKKKSFDATMKYVDVTRPCLLAVNDNGSWSRRQNYPYYIFLILFLTGFGSCSGMGGPGAGGLGGSGLQGDPASGGGGDDGGTTIQDGTGGGGSPEAMPPVSIPAPTLQSNLTLAYNAAAGTETGYVPYIGTPGAADPGEGNQVLVSADVITAQLETPQFPPFKKGGLGGILTTFISIAHAEPASMDVLPELPEDLSICNVVGNTCCPINPDGSFECYLPTDMSIEQIYAAVITPDGEVGAPVEEAVHANLLWVAAKPSVSKPVVDKIYSLVEGKMVKTQLSDGNWRVTGDQNNGYEDFAASGNSFGFDSMNNLFGVLDAGDGIGLYHLDPLLGTVQWLETATSARAADYTVIKYVNENLLYGILEKTAQNNARIFYALDDFDALKYGLDETFGNSIEFIKSDDKSAEGIDLTHSRTITFDVDADGYVLVVFEDEDGAIRIRMSDGDENRFGREISLAGTHEFIDIQIFHKNTSATDYGKALLLDRPSNRLWIVEYNHKIIFPPPPDFNFEIKSFSKSVDLGENKNPQAFVLNSDKTKAYVINQGDETLTVVDLTKDIPESMVTATIQLADYVPDKQLTYIPNSITYKDGHLFVGSEGIRGQLVINTSSIN